MRNFRAAKFTLWLLLAVLALLAAGGIQLRHNYLSRGFIEGLPEPIEGGGAVLGINVSLEQFDEELLAENLAQIRDLGIRYVKQSFYFTHSPDWAASDLIISAAAEHDLILVPLLDGDPDNGFLPPDDLSDFVAWTAEFASRYGTQLSHYFVWDEPNLASHWGGQPANAAAYAALLASAAEAIRAADNDAVIIAAPLAPTVEKGPQNLADPLFLQQMYEAGAADSFDLVAAKPYGFHGGPDVRTVDLDELNFSRAILLREVMEQNGDGDKAIWAGNWGWNSLPLSWSAAPSIWGQATSSEQSARTVAGITRAQREWPWMGVMFLENWQPNAPKDDPIWGFNIAGSESADAIRDYLSDGDASIAMPGFRLATPSDLSQQYEGDWRFAPAYGADISASGDSVEFTFWGTDVGIRVRRADFRARLYITIDGAPANGVPSDEKGATLVLTSPDSSEDYISIERVARGLPVGNHTMNVVASGGWDQWALNGFSVGYQPSGADHRWQIAGFLFLLIFASLLAYREGKKANWGAGGIRLRQAFLSLTHVQQLALTAGTATMVALMGWLTWGEQAAGIYRRFGDGTQLAFTAAAASVFYIAPSFVVYGLALAALFLLISFRPAWGVALIAFCIPLYVLPKPLLGYRFSPVELFTLTTLAAMVVSKLMGGVGRSHLTPFRTRFAEMRSCLHPADYAVLLFALLATISLLFTERIDVASNEWRAVILEPVLFYLLIRTVIRGENEMWVVLDSFILGGLLVSVYGLWQVGTGQGLITAEGGLMRLRSFYGSPNNVALYLGRIFPLLAAVALMGAHGSRRRRFAYSIALLPVGLAILLSFSKGGLFLGIPAATLFILWQWLRANGRRPWPWLLLLSGAGVVLFFVALQIPQLAGRFDLGGATGVFRMNLWRSSLNMISDHPWLGVGLDNFLYAYRGRYILDAAWQEPDLSHPHNLILDLATRLGVLGLLAGSWLIWTLGRTLYKLRGLVSAVWLPVIVGLGAALADMLAHGMVDHAFFLVDLAFAFYLILGTAVWLHLRVQP